MNCTQFENRIQLLLDERVDPRLDLTLQRHARSCQCCRLALSIYSCLDSPAAPDDQCPALSAGQHATSWPQTAVADHDTTGWRSLRSYRAVQLLLATAALVAICLLPGWQSDTGHSLARSKSQAQPFAHAEAAFPGSTGNSVADSESAASQLDPGLSNWLPVSFPAMSMSDVNLYSMAQIDLIYLVPEKHIQTVRGIPATIESIEPYYRYSAEIPVISQWSGGIHYTLGLIRDHLPIVSPNRPVGNPDFGWHVDFENRFLCQASGLANPLA